MSVIVNIATYPAREEAMPKTLDTLYKQVDGINLVLNEYRFVPKCVWKYPNVNPVLPEYDLKDVGKFYPPVADDGDDMFLCDDDILYPEDYVETMQEYYKKFAHLSPILGTHGVTYSDFFEGLPASREVLVFFHALENHRLVNQVGTGTVMCKGWQMPDFEFMESSQKFVDLRLAVHAYRKKFPMICVKREKGWQEEQDAGEAIFTSFTKFWEPHITAEAQEIAGFSKLDPEILPIVEAA